mgnify:CR=1 FL=1
MAYTLEQIGQAWQAYDAAVARGDTDTAFAVRKQIQTMQPQQNTATSRIDKAWQMYGDAVSKGDFDRALVLRKQIQAMEASGTAAQRYTPVPLQQAAPQRDVLAQAQRAVRMGQLSKEDYDRIVREQRGLDQTQKQAAQAFTPALEPSQFAPPPLPVAAPQPVAAPPQRSAPGRYTAEGPGAFEQEYAAQTYPQGQPFAAAPQPAPPQRSAPGRYTAEGPGVFEDAAAFEPIDTTSLPLFDSGIADINFQPVDPGDVVVESTQASQTPEQTLAAAMPSPPSSAFGQVSGTPAADMPSPPSSGDFTKNLGNALNTDADIADINWLQGEEDIIIEEPGTSAPPTTPGTSMDVGATQQTSGDAAVEPGLKGWQLREKFKALPIEEQEAKKQLAKQAALPAALGILQAGLEFMPTAQEKEAERLRNIDPAKKARLEQKRFLDATAGGAGEPEYFDQLAKANMALGNTGARGFTQAARIAGQHAAQKDAQKYDAASRVYEQTYAGAEAQRQQALLNMQTTGEKRKEAVMGMLSGEGPFAQALGMLSASKGVRIDESALAKLDPVTKKLFFETYKDNPQAAIEILEALTSGQSQEQSETA